MSSLLKYLLTPAILLSFIFLHPVVAPVVLMTLLAQRIHVAFRSNTRVTQREAAAAGRDLALF